MVPQSTVEKLFNTIILNATFLYAPKTSENLTIFWSFQWAEKGCIGNEWVKTLNFLRTASTSSKQLLFPKSHFCSRYYFRTSIFLQLVMFSIYQLLTLLISNFSDPKTAEGPQMTHCSENVSFKFHNLYFIQ